MRAAVRALDAIALELFGGASVVRVSRRAALLYMA